MDDLLAEYLQSNFIGEYQDWLERNLVSARFNADKNERALIAEREQVKELKKALEIAYIWISGKNKHALILDGIRRVLDRKEEVD